MLVKICGITTRADGRSAEAAGADFLGLVFVERSRRFVEVRKAGAILKQLAGTARPVGLFQNEDLDTVVRTVSELGLGMVQLHGRETPVYVNRLMKRLPGCGVIKAVGIAGPKDLLGLVDYFGKVDDPRRLVAFLLDSAGGGGTGARFDWPEAACVLREVKESLPLIFLAGGLTVDNLSEAIRIVGPDGVDVSSGVERSPGRKDPDKVRRFIRLAKRRLKK